MNYRHGFHAGNHADVLKHVVLLALLDALKRKDAPFLVLDTHAGRGRYDLGGAQAGRTGEAQAGIVRLQAAAPDGPPALRRYLDAVAQVQDYVPGAYPGSPLLVADALRDDDRLDACELLPEEAEALRVVLAGDPRCHVHLRDGYGAVKALLPPRDGAKKLGRALVLVDPPYEAQDGEFAHVLAALREGLARFPSGLFAVWYPIKRRATLQPFFRKVAALPAKSALAIELLVRPDDSPLRMNGSGMLLVNPPWKIDQDIEPALKPLARHLGEAGASWRLTWLRTEDSR
jgi:23S rRNA (adenine2030-N6)-methyltransferase